MIASSPDHATLLGRIVQAAELAHRSVIPNGERIEQLTQLRAQVFAKKMPIDGVFLVTDWDVMVVDTLLLLEHARAHGDRGAARAWQQVLGVMLPEVREHWWAAIEWRRDTKPTP